MGAPTDPNLVLVGERDGAPELVVNFGIFSGREATPAEIDRLAEALLRAVPSLEIVCEQRYEFGQDGEARVYQVRIELPPGASPDLAGVVDEWARDCIAERKVAGP